MVSKIIANRVKRIIGDLVGNWQFSFIPGHQMMNNVVITQKVIHYIRIGCRKRSGMVVKIDLEKEYDRVDWKFLEDDLREVGFGEFLIRVIMGYLTSSQLSVLRNSTRLDSFKPERGLRQGDPLSPYMFMLCMEVLV